MIRKIGAVGLMVALLAGSGFASLASAGGESSLPRDTHVHVFNVCKRADAGYNVDGGVCIYLYGEDQNGNPIYKDDCRKTDQYQWCNYSCRICGKLNDTQKAHPHYVRTVHSVKHP